MAFLDAHADSLATDGVIVLRHGTETPFSAAGLTRLRCDDQREFGSMRILLLTRDDRPESPGA